MSGERTEKASEQRKKQTRAKGDTARSRELMNSAAMLGGLLLLRGASKHFVDAWAFTFTTALNSGMRRYDDSDALSRILPAMLLPGVAPLALVMSAAFFGAVATGAMQTGGVQIHAGALQPGFSRLNPVSNLKNMFSARSLVRFAKSLLPAAVVVMLATASLKSSLTAVPIYSQARLPMTLHAAYALAVNAAWISLGWSGLDYVNEWRMWNGKLKMTSQEVKQELKESNGNPQIKGRIRQIQRSMRRRRVKADMSRAAVVITNPTHYAVALEFDFTLMGAPRVLAKGRDLHALEIREEARWAGVPIVENPPLARSLYRSVEAGQSIPFQLYAAVAAILAYLFRESQQRTQQQARQAGHTDSRAGFAVVPRTMAGTVEYRSEGEV